MTEDPDMQAPKDSSATILTVDVGNTAVKASIYEGERLVHSVAGSALDSEAVESLLDYHSPIGAAYCCVGRDDRGVGEMLRREIEGPVLELGADTRLPIEVNYQSRATLGADRLAAAAGVASPGADTLIVDAGTAVTIDLVHGMRFMGGNISPGLRLRFRSLNVYTSRLPLVDPEGDLPRFGHDTVTAIRAGVLRGLAGEISYAWHSARRTYPDLKVVICGGDAGILCPLLEDNGLTPLHDPQAVGRGLVRIFRHNNNISEKQLTRS